MTPDPDQPPGHRRPRSASDLSHIRRLRRARIAARNAWRVNRLFLYAAVCGVFGGLGAPLFTWMLDWGERLFMGGIAGVFLGRPGLANTTNHFGHGWYWLLPISTTLGGLLCGFLVYTFAPEAEGDGTDAAVRSYHFGGARVRPIAPVIKAISSAITIGSGGSAGREGPTAQISVGASSIFCDLLGLGITERRILVLSGMAAGLAAIFRSPLGMAIFAIEILYGGLASEYEALPFTLVASVVAYAVNGLFAGWTPIFLLPSGMGFNRPVELVGYALVGVVAGAMGAIQPTIFWRTRDVFRRLKIPVYFKPALGGLLMGLFAIAFPQTLATGYGYIQMVLNGTLVGNGLLLLAFAKIISMSLTLSSGGSGGTFGPNVFIGSLVGGWVAFVVDKWIPEAHLVPAAFAAVGMGAVFAGSARVPMATLIMVAELTGGYRLIVPSMLATSLSFLVQRTLVAGARYPILTESQVEARMDSPVHHLRLVQGALRILGGRLIQDLRGVSLPDLGNLLRSGLSIGIQGGKGRIFSVILESGDDPFLGQTPAEAFLPHHDDLAVVAVIRNETVLSPTHAGPLERGDQVILAAEEAVFSAFVQNRERVEGPAPGIE